MNDKIHAMLAAVAEQFVAWAKEQGQATGRRLAVDGTEFMAECAANLKRWTALALAGDLTVAEVEDLVRGQADLAKMRALTELGLTLVEIEKQRVAMLNAIAGLVGAGIKNLKG